MGTSAATISSALGEVLHGAAAAAAPLVVRTPLHGEDVNGAGASPAPERQSRRCAGTTFPQVAPVVLNQHHREPRSRLGAGTVFPQVVSVVLIRDHRAVRSIRASRSDQRR